MTNPTVLIHNVETNEIIERPMTTDELSQWQLDTEKANQKIQEEITTELAKATEKAALLAKLGITAEEAALLLA